MVVLLLVFVPYEYKQILASIIACTLLCYTGLRCSLPPLFLQKLACSCYLLEEISGGEACKGEANAECTLPLHARTEGVLPALGFPRRPRQDDDAVPHVGFILSHTAGRLQPAPGDEYDVSFSTHGARYFDRRRSAARSQPP